jgi:putative ABC transport system permease protein
VALAKKALQPLQQGMSVAIVLALVVAGFLVFNTMSMAALERRRELATLRAIGGRRRPLLVGFLGEAAVLGLVGSMVGAVAGIGVARLAITKVPTIYLDLLGVRPTFALPGIALPAAIAVGTLATVAAAFFPARSAVRVPPVEAMRPEGVLEAEGNERGVRPLFVAIGFGLFLGGSLLTAFGTGSATMGGFGAITIGTVVATFGLTGPLATAVARLAGRLGASGRLAAAGIERSPRRVWSTTLAVVVAVGIVIALGGLIGNEKDSFAADFASLAHTDLWVQTSTPDTIPVQARLPPEWVTQIAAIPGVAQVVRDQATYMALDGDQVVFEGVDSGSNVPFYRVAGAKALPVLDGHGILVSKGWATRHHHHVGDPITLPTPSGNHIERIAEIVDVPVVVQGLLGIDFERFNKWFSRPAMTGIEVNLAPGADRVAVRKAVERIAGAPSAAHVYTGAEELDGSNRSLGQSLAIFNAMVWVVVGASALAMLNTLAISVVERRREIGILRAIGTSRKVIRRMVMTEAAAITATGWVIGTALGIVQHRVAVAAVVGLVGFSVNYTFVFAPLATAAIAAGAMTVAGSIGPAWRAARTNVIEAIGYD